MKNLAVERYLGDTRDLSVGEMENNDCSWMVELIDHIGEWCVTTNGKIGIFCGISEDEQDYYYKVLLLNKNYLYETCCSYIHFLEGINEADSTFCDLRIYYNLQENEIN